jgi:mRNA-degrading endonuclease toxin of MazEF toxin-antitoxin module
MAGQLKRGEIYHLKGTGNATEIDGKPRPILIVGRNELNGGHSVLAVPFYSQQLDRRSGFKSCVLFRAGDSSLLKDCVAKTDEITLVHMSKIDIAAGPVDTVSDRTMERIDDALRWSLGLPEEE